MAKKHAFTPADQARVRVAAMVAAGNATLGEAFLSRIIDEAGAFSDPAQQIQHVVMRTREHVGTEKPMNVSATPWDQLVLARLGKNLAPWERLMIASALGDVGDAGSGDIRGGGSKGAAYTRELAGGDVLKSLVGQGYSREHAMGAIAFAHEMGTSETMAHKFVKIGKEGQDKLKEFMAGLDPNLTEEERRKAVADFRKGNPKLAEHMTDGDVLKTYRDFRRKQAELKGEQAEAFDKSQAVRVAENKDLGVQRQVAAQYQANAIDLRSNPGAGGAEQDELAALAQRRVTQSTPDAQSKTKATATQAGDVAAPQRTAAHTSASPKMGG